MLKQLALALAATLVATTVFAFGSHDNDCTECHSLHYAKGQSIIGVVPNTTEANPATGGKAMDDVSLCLGCHNDDEGIMPILLKTTHPVGMKPKNVKVPAELLRANGALGCVSCHDPHPSNPNFSYLQGEGITKSNLGEFCSICHAEKADQSEFAPKQAAPATKQ